MLTYSFYEEDTRVEQYAKSLRKRGDSVDVIALRREGLPKFEIVDGAVVHPLIAPWPGLSPQERAENERARAWAYYLRGGGGDPRYFEGERAGDER